MFDADDGRAAVRLAREIVEAKAASKRLPCKSRGGLPEVFYQKMGVFVTLNTYPELELRGCIGIPEPVMPLYDALAEAAGCAANDPRFLPLRAEEMDHIVVEVTILTKPELVDVKKPEDYIKRIAIGRDGLIAWKGGRSGLLLPQVPVEWGWDELVFLEQTCIKAGLPRDAWTSKGFSLYAFSGEVFAEESPRGGVIQKNLCQG
ncbi:MAG: TIGR00296 family protein [Thermoplasmata archaeon HGW-Thermoplasmata-1]|nr:MAG: TIGR00296 family protein [Thermoplasmata archaeon HGW-Thermoplasmata-1]